MYRSGRPFLLFSSVLDFALLYSGSALRKSSKLSVLPALSIKASSSDFLLISKCLFMLSKWRSFSSRRHRSKANLFSLHAQNRSLEVEAWHPRRASICFRQSGWGRSSGGCMMTAVTNVTAAISQWISHKHSLHTSPRVCETGWSLFRTFYFLFLTNWLQAPSCRRGCADSLPSASWIRFTGSSCGVVYVWTYTRLSIVLALVGSGGSNFELLSGVVKIEFQELRFDIWSGSMTSPQSIDLQFQNPFRCSVIDVESVPFWGGGHHLAQSKF